MADVAEEERRAAPPRRFRGAIQKTTGPTGRHNPIPPELLEDVELRQAIDVLPRHYNFEILKTLWRLRQAQARRVALQFPEGLLMYACVISDILTRFAHLEHCFVLGDVTYGACCVDDFTAKALKCDFLVHYGHSCLVPVDVTQIPCLYIFVTIEIDVEHLCKTLQHNFPSTSRLALAGTIQFSPAIHAAKERLQGAFQDIEVPQSRPLSAGEVLGCTAPRLLSSVDALVFVADGRFHLEALMMANPTTPAFRYDPYTSQLTREMYDHSEMQRQRRKAIEKAQGAQRWGIIQGSLGRQGNPAIVQKIKKLLVDANRMVVNFVMSEISPSAVSKIEGIDAWVQVGCPRLSIDWGPTLFCTMHLTLLPLGQGFEKPVLTPYEAMAAMEAAPHFWEEGNAYPMDYYAKDSGPWSSSYHKKRSHLVKRHI